MAGLIVGVALGIGCCLLLLVGALLLFLRQREQPDAEEQSGTLLTASPEFRSARGPHEAENRASSYTTPPAPDQIYASSALPTGLYGSFPVDDDNEYMTAPAPNSIYGESEASNRRYTAGPPEVQYAAPPRSADFPCDLCDNLYTSAADLTVHKQKRHG